VWDVPDDLVVPDVLGRTMFRVVQEALTNVHKHARGAATRVHVRAVPGHRLDVEVANRRPVGTDIEPLLPGTGAGLAGITERVRLAGGAVWAGPTDDGFLLRATIPWPAPAVAPTMTQFPSLEARP
jgi:signal transduction histidine kinase